MFEDLTIEQQRQRTAGWKNPVTHCTASAVVFRWGKSPSVRDSEILVARRTSGTPEALGFYQTHFGTYVHPTDETAEAAIRRGLTEKIGITARSENLTFTGIIGPALWKSTVHVADSKLVLEVHDEQAEKLSPFLMCIFSANATGFTPKVQDNTIDDMKWLKFDDLINQHGSKTDWIYWSIFYLWVQKYSGRATQDDLCVILKPGTYKFELV